MNKLTAEQVRKAIFNGSAYASYDGAKYYADGINMQAIADELNTRADDYKQAAEYWQRMYEQTFAEQTCRSVDPDFPFFECSECGCNAVVGYGSSGDGLPNYCPNCGAKVVSE